MKIIIATGNEGKMREIREIMKGEDVTVTSLKDEGLENVEIDETGKTFEENAIIKAKTISEVSGEIVIADDSGLAVDALNGEPGIYSARYLGRDTSYDYKNNYIIKQLEGKEGAERSARFVCAMACVLPDGKVITTEGTIEGQIGFEQKGENGFGYDPIFFLPERGKTTAEISPEEKNEISHRGKALTKMYEKLKEEGVL
ncbi:MAG: XTP/dITP diphosphatase [Lachnospiraceae bacterium]|nr:XTP/dITP diphosphatase [Lachnospiraceae bacterium]